ncbi:MAG: hypothetical protein HN368_06630 [Spirochaetales bacterium]|jgi:hypothetical protein|nr:hypothetical protein [Spirochaetales bacterium]
MSLENAKKIRIKLAGKGGATYGTEPLTFGIPFAEFDLPSTGGIRVTDANDRSIPVQYECRTTWDKDLRQVRWLLADIQKDEQLKADAALTVEYPVKSDKIEDRAETEKWPQIRIKESSDFFSIDTGELQVDFRRSFDVWKLPNKPAVIAGCRLKTKDGWLEVLRGDGPVLYMKDQHGRCYDSLSSGFAPEVILEERGPLRVCVLIKGFLASAEGVRFCPYQLRIHLYAGKSDLRIFHTFIFDQDPHGIELSAVGIDFPLALGDGLRAAVGGENGAAHFYENWRSLSILQYDDEHYNMRRNGAPCGAGKRAPGWASLCGTKASAAVAIRDAWQEYPAGFMLSEKGIDVQIWPESFGRPLVFTTPFEEKEIRFYSRDKNGPMRSEEEVREILAENPTAPLNLKSFNIRSLEEARWVEEMVEKYAPGRIMGYNDLGTQNGLGAAKTTEVVIRLSGERLTDTESFSFSETVNNPLRAIVDPEYLCGTGALEHFYHSGDPRFSHADADLDDYFEPIIIDPVEQCKLYGKMRFGNMVCVHSSAVPWVYLLYKDSEPLKALRYVGSYNNEANDQIMGVWGQFIRTGNPDYLRVAERYSRAVADLAFVHAHPGHPEHEGVMHYHSDNQWSGGYSPSHSVISGILTDYYLTGNRRLLEVATEAANRIVRTQEPAGILSCRHAPLHREYTGPLAILLDAYQATWEEKYGILAERSLSWLLRLVRTPGRLPNSLLTAGPRGDEALVLPECFPEVAWGNKYHLYAPALRYFPSKALKDFLIAEADYFVWELPKTMLNYACTTVCFAYDLLHKPEYAYYGANLIATLLREYVDDIRQNRQFDFSAMKNSSFVPRLMRIIAAEMDRDPDGFEQGLAKWVKKRSAMPDRPEEVRPDDAVHESLGILSTEPHPRD